MCELIKHSHKMNFTSRTAERQNDEQQKNDDIFIVRCENRRDDPIQIDKIVWVSWLCVLEPIWLIDE